MAHSARYSVLPVVVFILFTVIDFYFFAVSYLFINDDKVFFAS